jgi:hypothetical protein
MQTIHGTNGTNAYRHVPLFQGSRTQDRAGIIKPSVEAEI